MARKARQEEESREGSSGRDTSQPGGKDVELPGLTVTLAGLELAIQTRKQKAMDFFKINKINFQDVIKRNLLKILATDIKKNNKKNYKTGDMYADPPTWKQP
ncbi:hypothetical protein STEG23_001630 [Scotinomys teguina]